MYLSTLNEKQTCNSFGFIDLLDREIHQDAGPCNRRDELGPAQFICIAELVNGSLMTPKAR